MNKQTVVNLVGLNFLEYTYYHPRQEWKEQATDTMPATFHLDDSTIFNPAAYIDLWLREIAPDKLAKSTIRRDQQDSVRILSTLGHYKLTELWPEHFRAFYAKLRETVSAETKKPLSEHTVEGVHATLCSILSDALKSGFSSHKLA